MLQFFTRNLIRWHNHNPRPLPWSDGSCDPYRIWLSEIIMQQTRIEQGTSYYLGFINKYPNVQGLASASIDDVLRMWEGLGYYTRARNMHKAAVYIARNLNGKFPDTYGSLLNLPGIGPYSAAAIASFAFNLPHVVVDGNVKRLVARFAGITNSVDDPKTHKEIHHIASDFMKGSSPALFNQAIMNFGALVCKPLPLCEICPLSKRCYAINHNMVSALPVRRKKQPLRARYLHFLVLQHDDKILMCKREKKDIWNGLYSFPHVEKSSVRSPGSAQLFSAAVSLAGKNVLIEKGLPVVYTQTLSHQTITGRFHAYRVTKRPRLVQSDSVWIPVSSLDRYGKPRMIVRYLEDRLKFRQ